MYFPKPGRELMGVWALDQARAFARAGVEVRVLSLSPWFPAALRRLPKRRGAETIATWAGMPARHQWGEVTAEYPRWPYYHLDLLSEHAYRRPGLQLSPAWRFAAPRLRSVVRDWSPHAIYAHESMRNGWLARRLHDESAIPFATVDHSFEEVADAVRLPARRRIVEYVSERATGMVGVSNRMSEDLRSLSRAAPVVTIPNGADPIPPAILERGRPRELEGRMVVTSVGMFYPRKGMPMLVRAFARVAARHPRAVLRIVGDGADRPAVEAAVKEAGIEERVELLGARPHDVALQEIVWADVFALVGWDEPIGVAFLEAMAAGKPIIFSADGGLADVAEAGVHGLSVGPRDESAVADRLDQLLGDESLRMRLGHAARGRWAGDLTWDRNAERVLELFA